MRDRWRRSLAMRSDGNGSMPLPGACRRPVRRSRNTSWQLPVPDESICWREPGRHGRWPAPSGRGARRRPHLHTALRLHALARWAGRDQPALRRVHPGATGSGTSGRHRTPISYARRRGTNSRAGALEPIVADRSSYARGRPHAWMDDASTASRGYGPAPRIVAAPSARSRPCSSWRGVPGMGAAAHVPRRTGQHSAPAPPIAAPASPTTASAPTAGAAAVPTPPSAAPPATTAAATAAAARTHPNQSPAAPPTPTAAPRAIPASNPAARTDSASPSWSTARRDTPAVGTRSAAPRHEAARREAARLRLSQAPVPDAGHRRSMPRRGGCQWKARVSMRGHGGDSAGHQAACWPRCWACLPGQCGRRGQGPPPAPAQAQAAPEAPAPQPEPESESEPGPRTDPDAPPTPRHLVIYVDDMRERRLTSRCHARGR